MNFVSLRGYIDTHLHNLSTNNFTTVNAPQSKSDFLELLSILISKTKSPNLPPAPILPELPSEPEEPPPYPSFKPSLAFESLQEQYNNYKNQLEAKINDPDATKRSIKKLESKISFTLIEMKRLLKQEQDLHAQSKNDYLKSYQQKLSAYKKILTQRKSLTNQHIARCEDIKFKHTNVSREWKRYCERIARDIEKAFSPSGRIPTNKINWEILPPGTCTLDRVLQHYTNLVNYNPHINYDVSRIHGMFSLNPSTCYIGMNEFDGYIVFAFENSKKVALECPVYGNAIYVLSGEWRSLSRLSKNELLNKHPDQVERIVHVGDWCDKLHYSLFYKSNWQRC
jgi:hypothetical protein